ncbi:phage late control D family protein [Anaerobacillus sp. MEB173]|uniref:phage late control D family protein n=1 Tax=Anaerobacillus sp. MEB173 TaxID=3383345 RepID=UPI003F939899
MLSRRSSVSVEYESIDITKEVSKDLKNFVYTDNASGESDDISLTLKDEKKKWINDWFPEKGDVITPVIHTLNWRKNGDTQKLPCGRFFVDEPEFSGRPSEVTIRAISSPLFTDFSQTDKSRTWNSITLKQIASDIAKRAGLTLQYIGNNNPRFSSVEQTETTDSSFLSALCEEEGLAMKVTDKKLVIFDEQEFEKRNAVAMIQEWSKNTLHYSFKSSLADTCYAGVNVKFRDTKTKKTIEYLYKAPNYKPKIHKIYQLNKKVESRAEAMKLAKRTLRNLNKKEVTGNLSVIGNVEILGATCVNLKGFGKFDGKYFVEKSTHSIGSGYVTDIEVRKVLEGY